MAELYTTKEIADKYGGEQKNITPYMITQSWIPNGLKHIRGKGKGYLFKLEWVEQYLEEVASNDNKVNKNKTFNIRKQNANIKEDKCFVV